MQFRIALAAGLALVALNITPEEAAGPAPTPGRTVKAPLTPIVPNGSWPVYHHDDGHTGNVPGLPQLTTASTGWTSAALDGQIYASPLIYGGIVYAATLNNSVYALNQIDGAVIWHTNVGAPETGGWQCGNVSPQGILGTPAVDPTTGRIYVAAQFTSDDIYHVFGLNLTTGVIERNTPIPATIGTGFDWTIQQQRGALAVHNGYVYVPFGGRAGDCGNYSGWVVGVPTSGTGSLKVFQTAPTGNGIWNAGGIVIDDSTGNVFATTGNGVNHGTGDGCSADINGNPIFQNDAVVKLSPTLAETGFFMPPDWQSNWCSNDQDLGSASALLISPKVLFQAGKWGTGFLLDPTNLGGVGGQRYPTPLPATYAEANVCFGNNSDATFGSFAYSAPFIYVECEGQGLVALHLDASVPSLPTFSPCDTCAAPDWHAGGSTTFGPPIVAAGAVWVASDSGLYAYRAGTGALIYHSAIFGINRFVTPAEAGCTVFVPSHTVIRSFVMHFGPGQSCPMRPPARTVPASQTIAPPPTGRPSANQSSPAPTPPGR